jgi:3-methyladenine DNA glycosylase AlkD
MSERPNAIVSTVYFIGKGDVEDAFKLAEIMLQDREGLIHKANGWALRFAGDKDRQRLISLLDKHAAHDPALRHGTFRQKAARSLFEFENQAKGEAL